MTGKKYRQALLALRLTHEDAAKQLDIARRTSLRYAKADRVPTAIALALEGLAARRRQEGGNIQ